MNIIKLESKQQFLTTLIDLTLLLKLPAKFYLRPKEKEFLVNSIVLSNEGYSLESTEMVRAICKIMDIKHTDVYTYRNILKKKGWLIQTTDGLNLLSALDYSKKKIPLEQKFNFTLKISK